MDDPQRQADRIRELVAESDTLRRLGVEVVRAVGTDDELTVRARRAARMLTAQRGRGWLVETPEHMADTLSRDLAADVLAPAPVFSATGPRWGRAADHAMRRPGPTTP